MTLEELSRHDGREGRPAYVAVSGTIYDVGASPLWRDGQHENSHQAGADLTEELKSAPHVRTVIERFPVVGKLDTAPGPQSGKTGGLTPLSLAIIAVVILLLIVTYIVAL